MTEEQTRISMSDRIFERPIETDPDMLVVPPTLLQWERSDKERLWLKYTTPEPYIVSVVVSCHPNHYKSHDSWGRSRAIAAASAYPKAIGGGDRG